MTTQILFSFLDGLPARRVNVARRSVLFDSIIGRHALISRVFFVLNSRLVSFREFCLVEASQ